MSARLVTRHRRRVLRGAAPASAPAGYSLPELVLALSILAIAAAAGLQGLRGVLDGVAVRGATADIRAAFTSARALATRRGERAALRLDTVAGTVSVHVRGDTVLRRPLAALYRVRFTSTRDSAAYGASGAGYGGSNLRVVVRRGRVVDTVVVSRVGRVR